MPGYGRGGSWSICVEWSSPRAHFYQFEEVKLRVGLGRGVRYYKELRIEVRVMMGRTSLIPTRPTLTIKLYPPILSKAAHQAPDVFWIASVSVSASVIVSVLVSMSVLVVINRWRWWWWWRWSWWWSASEMSTLAKTFDTNQQKWERELRHSKEFESAAGVSTRAETFDTNRQKWARELRHSIQLDYLGVRVGTVPGYTRVYPGGVLVDLCRMT